MSLPTRKEYLCRIPTFQDGVKSTTLYEVIVEECEDEESAWFLCQPVKDKQNDNRRPKTGTLEGTITLNAEMTFRVKEAFSLKVLGDIQETFLRLMKVALWGSYQVFGEDRASFIAIEPRNVTLKS